MTSDDLADRLHSAAIHLLRRVRKEDDASGLTAPKLSALSVLVFGGPRTVGALAAVEQVRPPTMSVLIRDLERAGLVVRRRGEDDGRQVLIEPTDEARRLLHEGRQRRTAWLAERLRGRSEEEVTALAKAAEVLGEIVRAEHG
jgi:DNA-binding MarR family transcriptional regulator